MTRILITLAIVLALTFPAWGYFIKTRFFEDRGPQIVRKIGKGTIELWSVMCILPYLLLFLSLPLSGTNNYPQTLLLVSTWAWDNILKFFLGGVLIGNLITAGIAIHKNDKEDLDYSSYSSDDIIVHSLLVGATGVGTYYLILLAYNLSGYLLG